MTGFHSVISDVVLTGLYLCTLGLCLFMVMWIFIAPGTLFRSMSRTEEQTDPGHRITRRSGKTQTTSANVHDARSMGAALPSPSATSVVLHHLSQKYQGHYDIIFLHIFASGVWAALAPLQFLAPLRRSFPAFHRYTGYVFVVSAIATFLGLCLIVLRRLVFLDYDWTESGVKQKKHDPRWNVPLLHTGGHMKCMKHKNHDSSSSQSADPPQTERSIPSQNAVVADEVLRVLLYACQLWYLFTVLWAVSYARAGDYKMHRKYMYRHVGSGIWIALQRLYFGIFVADQHVTARRLRNAFGEGTLFAFVTMTAAELAIWLQN